MNKPINAHKLRNMLHRVQSARNQVALGLPLGKKHYTQRLRLYRKACAAVGLRGEGRREVLL